MISKVLKKLRVLVIIAIIVAFVWFLAVYPTYKFKEYESQIKKAAERYYELNPTKLPTGERVSTVTLQELFREAYLKEDLYIPYSKKPCSTLNSWVKVTKNNKNKNDDYKYYIYLECGALKSTIDHKGPVITLKGDEEMNVEIDSKFKDPGISKVYDKKDGNLDIKETTIAGTVDTSKIGTYTIKYTAVDKLGNKTTVERKVNVINTLKTQVKKGLGKETRYKGNPENNYIMVSNMMHRIVGLDDKNNVMVVAEHPVSYINYNKIDKWLNDYYYNLLSDKAKKIIVESEYCESVKDNSATDCSIKTNAKKIYYPSVVDVNLAEAGGENFMKTDQLSWINSKGITAIGVYNQAFYEELYKELTKTSIAAIRPMTTINGKLKILSGDGTRDNPFILKDYIKPSGDKQVSDLMVGDIIKNKGVNYIVIGQLSDGTTKVITYSNISTMDDIVRITNTEKTPFIYNPNKKTNIGYKINNQLTKYVDKSIFEAHQIEVPIYKNKIVYGEETKTKKYKVLFSAPNVFEMFSVQNYVEKEISEGSTWFINSSSVEDTGIAVDTYGDVIETVYNEDVYGIRAVAYIKKNQNVSGGSGTYEDPYTIR